MTAPLVRAGALALCALPLLAQGDLASLQKTAEQKTAEWDALAKTLESKLVRLLPCDARVKTSIEEVNRASDARLAALTAYSQAAAAQSHAEAQIVAQAMAAQEAAVRESATDRAEAEQERIALEAQNADLTEAVKKRAQLSGAQAGLTAITAMLVQRSADAQEMAVRRATLVVALRELAGAYDARDKAIQSDIAALNTEKTRWIDYYAARMARAETECSITNQGPDRQTKRPPQRKKQ